MSKVENNESFIKKGGVWCAAYGCSNATYKNSGDSINICCCSIVLYMLSPAILVIIHTISL
jgi:hypothetical protein